MSRNTFSIVNIPSNKVCKVPRDIPGEVYTVGNYMGAGYLNVVNVDNKSNTAIAFITRLLELFKQEAPGYKILVSKQGYTTDGIETLGYGIWIPWAGLEGAEHNPFVLAFWKCYWVVSREFREGM